MTSSWTWKLRSLALLAVGVVLQLGPAAITCAGSASAGRRPPPVPADLQGVGQQVEDAEARLQHKTGHAVEPSALRQFIADEVDPTRGPATRARVERLARADDRGLLCFYAIGVKIVAEMLGGVARGINDGAVELSMASVSLLGVIGRASALGRGCLVEVAAGPFAGRTGVTVELGDGGRWVVRLDEPWNREGGGSHRELLFSSSELAVRGG